MNGQAHVRVESQPFQQSQAANQSYARPSSEPFVQPGSQPFVASGASAQTTGLANGSRWVGTASVALMGLAALLVLLGGLSKASDNPVAGFGILLAFLPISSGPVALI